MTRPTMITHPPSMHVIPTNNVQDGAVYDDMKFPFFGRKLDTAAGHLAYNDAELGIDFDDTSRYNDADMVAIIAQMLHEKKFGTDLRPHIHWMQSHANVPNIMMRWRWYNNGATPGAWANAAYNANVFTYTAGTILQIMTFPHISPPANESVSSICDIKIYRDAINASGLFAGADPLVGDMLTKEFDFHYEIDALGSQSEYVKF